MTFLKHFCTESPSEMGSALKGKHLSPKGTISFSIRADPFSEGGQTILIVISPEKLSIPLKGNNK